MIHSRAERLDYAKSHYLRNSADYKARAIRNNARARRAGRELVARYLSAHPCVDCGERDVVVLEFDHVRGEKRGNVADLVMSACSIQTITREIAKCDIRCANCHRRRTVSVRLERASARLVSKATDPQSRLEGL